MRKAGLEEAQAGIKIAGRNINDLRYAVDTTLMAENEDGPITSWKIVGKKAVTNLDSILISRDITLPPEVRLVKAVVFPVVMYGCES